jgi:tRNA threonylcarbamoyladenosine biosynthesis protein TsaB
VILLALDSATSVCSVALCDAAGDALNLRRGERAPDQADRLIELVDEALRDAALDYDALDVIAVNHGPGSFTGVRTGVAAARGLALALGRPVLAVNTLEVLAAALGPQPAGTIVAALDARRGQVFVQSFDHRLAPLAAPSVLAPDEIRLDEGAPPLQLVGNGAALIRAALPEASPIVSADAEVDALGVARRALARLAAGERARPGQEVQPLYLRPPDARLPAPRQARADAAVVGT